MTGAYKRPTKIFELPSGKKIELVTYFSKAELEEFRVRMLGGQKISGEKMIQASSGDIQGAELFKDMQFDIADVNAANEFARQTAIKKLIDKDGEEYEATPENIREFLEEADADLIDKEINEMNKKKLSEES